MRNFNFPNIDWCSHTVNAREKFTICPVLLCYTGCLSYMTQHVLSPTKRRDGQASSVLDLMFTLDPNMAPDLEHLSPLGHSNHEVLLWS